MVRLVALFCDVWNGNPDSDSGTAQQHHKGREQQLRPHGNAIMHSHRTNLPNMLVNDQKFHVREREREGGEGERERERERASDVVVVRTCIIVTIFFPH